MLRIFDNDQGIVEKNTFGFRPTYVMFVDALADVAVIPFKSGDLFEIDHDVYYQYIRKWRRMQYVRLTEIMRRISLGLSILALIAGAAPARAADAGFTQFIASL